MMGYLDTLLLLLVLALASMGAAQLVRALPGVYRAQAWLERTWTHGKPLSCWVCLVGWSGLVLLGLVWVVFPPRNLQDTAMFLFVWLGAVGVGGELLTSHQPILPTSGGPVIETDGVIRDDVVDTTDAMENAP